MHNVGNHIMYLQPSLTKFLANLWTYFELATWSSMMKRNVEPLVALIERTMAWEDGMSCFKFNFHKTNVA